MEILAPREIGFGPGLEAAACRRLEARPSVRAGRKQRSVTSAGSLPDAYRSRISYLQFCSCEHTEVAQQYFGADACVDKKTRAI
jgi:hypothetical protein